MNLAELEKEVETESPPAETPASVLLGELHQPVDGDGTELIANRLLSRCGSMILVGPTGAGKSSLVLQMAIHFAIGLLCFGLRAVGILRSLIVQAENDEGDLYEMREGIINGCGLTQDQRDKASRNVRIASINDSTGPLFIGRLERLIAEHKSDLVFIDPLLAYVGGDIGKQEVASAFLREWLTPVITKANCAVIIAHHPPKPRADNGNEKSTDDAYYGAGSAELFNWSRAVIVLKPTRAHGVYELKLAKRGRRAGWTEADGVTPSYKRMIGHGENGLIYWRELNEQESSTANVAPGKTKEDVLALVPMTAPIEKAALVSKAQGKGIGRTKAAGFISELVDAELLYVWRTKRPGTNPLQALCRQPQPQ